MKIRLDTRGMRFNGPRHERSDGRTPRLEGPAPLAFAGRDQRRRFDLLSLVMRCASGLAVTAIALTLALGGCGGSDSVPGAPSIQVASDARPAATTPTAAAPLPTAEARSEPAPAEAATHASVSTRSLRDALASLEADGIAVVVDPSIAGAAVAGDMGRGIKGDALVALLRGFDVVLLYGSSPSSASALKAVWVYPQGRAGEQMEARGTDVSRSNVRGLPLLPTDPTARAELLERDLASPDPALRRQALATSFALQTALPEHALLQTTRADPESDLRRVALQALARHPSADAAVVRTAVQAALADRDADVRGVARELLEQLDLAALPAESVPPPTASP